MKEEILNKINTKGNFDGVFNELFLHTPVCIDLIRNKEVVRVLDVDGELMIHVLDKDDNTEFISFNALQKEIQRKIYEDLCSC